MRRDTPLQQIQSVTIRKRRWRIVWVPAGHEPMADVGDGTQTKFRAGTDYGLCEHVKRRIYIREGQSPTQTLDTLIHEILHAELDGEEVTEARVRRTANTITRAVERLLGLRP